MAIPALTNPVNQLASLFQVGPTKSRVGVDQDGDGASSSKGGVAKSSKAAGGALIQSLLKSLSQMGGSLATGVGAAGSATALNTAASSSASATDQKQALVSFIQSLMAAIQAEAAKTINQTNAQTNQAISAITGAGSKHHGGMNKLEAGLQNLINDLASSSSSQSSTNSANTGAGSLDAILASLQTNANSLFAATGVNANQASLSTLLKSLQQSLASGAVTGNLVNTSA